MLKCTNSNILFNPGVILNKVWYLVSTHYGALIIVIGHHKETCPLETLFFSLSVCLTQTDTDKSIIARA